MTEIWSSPRGDRNTLALVVGVGEYPYCGDGATLAPAKAIKNLSSPSASAHSFAQFLIDHANDFAAPLASVELLTEPLDGSPFQPELPTFAAVRAAARRWQASTGKHDVPLLYWCGHGLEYNNKQLLLCRDAGFESTFWDYVVDLSEDRYRAYNSSPNTQLWLVDACRDPAEKLGLYGPSGRTLLLDVQTDDITAGARKDLGIVQASAPFAQAAGLGGKPSYFCDALMQAIEWGAWTPVPGGWEIRSTGLVDPINRWLREKEVAQRARNNETVGEHPIFQSASAPAIPSSFRCSPDTAQSSVRLSILRPPSPNSEHSQPAPSLDPWRVSVKGGRLLLEGEKDDHKESTDVWITPTLREGVLPWPH